MSGGQINASKAIAELAKIAMKIMSITA